MPLDIAEVSRRRPQNRIIYRTILDSTMRECTQLAEDGAPHGTIVIAEQQTAGMGRMGRSWHSEPETGIYCSIILRLPLQPCDTPIAALLLGLAAAEAIEKSCSIACDLRWPNDVLIDGKKVCGILAQLAASAIVAGIGINVNHERLPGSLRTPATSLRIETGGVQSRERLLCALLDSLDTFSGLLVSEGPAAIIRAFTAASSYALNRRVLLEDTGQRGITAGLDASGFLLVRLDSGQITRVAAGGVRPEI